MKHDGYALITGASRGLGMAFARSLAQCHCNVVLVVRSVEPLHAFAAELRQSSPVAVIAIQLDLSTPGAGRIVAEQLTTDGVPIELFVNNAGFGLRGESNGGGPTVPGALNKFSVFAQRLIPRRVVPKLVAKLSKA